MMFNIFLENGNTYRIKAESAKDAWSKAVAKWPELLHKDVRDIELELDMHTCS